MIGAFIHLHLQEHAAFVPYRDIDARTCIVVYEHDELANVQHDKYTKTSVRIETCSYWVYATYFSCSSMPLYFCVAFKSPAHTESHTKNVCTRHGEHCKPRHRRCAVGSSARWRAFRMFAMSSELSANYGTCVSVFCILSSCEILVLYKQHTCARIL